jgi:hypothetical protein
MKTLQFIKSLNNTELGKSGTNETYVLVSKNVKGIENMFDPANRKPSLINLKNGGILSSVHITDGGEFRINGSFMPLGINFILFTNFGNNSFKSISSSELIA